MGVLQGAADGNLYAYNAINGKKLWKYDAGLGISAPPVTYKLNGKQYVAILIGWDGAFAGVGNKNLGWDYNTHMRRLMVFSLDGKTSFPAQPPKYFPKGIIDKSFKKTLLWLIKDETSTGVVLIVTVVM